MANFGFFFLYTHFGNNFARSNLMVVGKNSAENKTAMKKNQIKEKKWEKPKLNAP